MTKKTPRSFLRGVQNLLKEVGVTRGSARKHLERSTGAFVGLKPEPTFTPSLQ